MNFFDIAFACTLSMMAGVTLLSLIDYLRTF